MQVAFLNNKLILISAVSLVFFIFLSLYFFLGKRSSENFYFENYSDINEMIFAVPKFLPLDMSKSEVDAILVQSAGASLKKQKSKDYRYDEIYVYRYKPQKISQIIVPFDWVFVAYYDKNKRLERLTINGRDVYDLPQSYDAPPNIDDIQ